MLRDGRQLVEIWESHVNNILYKSGLKCEKGNELLTKALYWFLWRVITFLKCLEWTYVFDKRCVIWIWQHNWKDI